MTLTVITPDLAADPTPQPSVARDSFATRLREVMEEKGLTQMQLAASIGVAQSRVSEWRAGKAMPQRRVAELLADQLQVNLEWLLAGTGSPTTPVVVCISVANRLRQLMRERGLTQNQIAQAAGVTQPAVSGWLNGSEPTATALLRLTDHLGIHPRDLIPA